MLNQVTLDNKNASHVKHISRYITKIL